MINHRVQAKFITLGVIISLWNLQWKSPWSNLFLLRCLPANHPTKTTPPASLSSLISLLHRHSPSPHIQVSSTFIQLYWIYWILEHFTGQTWDGLKGEMTWGFKSVAQVQTEVWELGASTSLSSIAWTLSEGQSAPDIQLWTLFILLLIEVRYLLFLLLTFVKDSLLWFFRYQNVVCYFSEPGQSIYQHICYSGHLTKLKILNSWIQHWTDKPFV